MGRVVVAGAGPGGLLVGRMFHRLGHEVLICDPQPAHARSGRRELLQPCGHRALDAAGLGINFLGGPEAEATPCGRMRCFTAGGRPAFAVDLGHLPAPYNQAWLYRVDALGPRLRETLPANALRLGSALVYLRPEGRGTRVRLSDGSEWAADLVVAADGAGSTVRTLARCVALVHAFAGSYFMCTVELDEALPAGEARQYLGRRSVGLVPLGDGRAYAWAHVRGKDDEATWRHAIQGTCPPLDDVGWPRWSEGSMLQAVEVHCPRWWAPGVVLIGDAAHALHPHGALGTNLALEDAVELARSAERLDTLDATVLGPAFQQARARKLRALQALARQRAWGWDTTNPLFVGITVRTGRNAAQSPEATRRRVLALASGLADRALPLADTVRLLL